VTWHLTIFLTVVCVKRIVIGVGLLLGLYLVVRAVAEPFVIETRIRSRAAGARGQVAVPRAM
jgi:hypothetical protein